MRVAKYQEPRVSLTDSFVAGKVGIVTITYNSRHVLGDFLASLDRQSYRNFVLIVVDNASQDTTLAQLEEHRSEQQIVIANTVNRGVAEGNNQGIRAAIEANCDYILLLNNDVTLDSEMLMHLVDGLSEHKCSMTVPMMYFHTPPNRIWAAGGRFQSKLGFRADHIGYDEEDSGRSKNAGRIDYAPTCCVLIRREVFAQIGLMDERFFVYSDDVDFMFRSRQAGIAMFLIPKAKLWHKVNSLTGGINTDFTYYYTARGRALFLYKHLSYASAFIWTSCHTAFDVVRALFRKEFRHPCKVKYRGMKDGKKVALQIYPQNHSCPN